MVRSLLQASLVLLLLTLPSLSRAEVRSSESFPLCSLAVARMHLSEVRAQRRSDKFNHCSLSCIMTLRCGPLGSFEVGVLKEIWDALGFGDPEWEDLIADAKGVSKGLEIGFGGNRLQCYQTCGELFP